MIYLYNAVLLSHEKKENPAFATIRKGLENITLSDISSTEKDNYYMASPTRGILKKKWLARVVG